MSNSNNGSEQSRRITIGCLIAIIVLTGLSSTASLRGWYYINGREEVYLDGSYEEMLASLSLEKRSSLEQDGVFSFRDTWNKFTGGKISRNELIRELEHFDLLNTFEQRELLNRRTVVGNEMEWVQIPSTENVNRSRLVVGNFDADISDEILVVNDAPFLIELNGGTTPFAFETPDNVRSAELIPESNGWPLGLLLMLDKVEEGSFFGHEYGILELNGEETGRFVLADFNNMQFSRLGTNRELALYGRTFGESDQKLPVLIGRNGNSIAEVPEWFLPPATLTGDIDGNGINELIGYIRLANGLLSENVFSYELGRGLMEWPLLPGRSTAGWPVWTGDVNGDGRDEILYDYTNLLVDTSTGEIVELEIPEEFRPVDVDGAINRNIDLLPLESGNALVAAVCWQETSPDILAVWSSHGVLLHWECIGDWIEDLHVVSDESGHRILLVNENTIVISAPGWTPE